MSYPQPPPPPSVPPQPTFFFYPYLRLLFFLFSQGKETMIAFVSVHVFMCMHTCVCMGLIVWGGEGQGREGGKTRQVVVYAHTCTQGCLSIYQPTCSALCLQVSTGKHYIRRCARLDALVARRLPQVREIGDCSLLCPVESYQWLENTALLA